MLQGDTGFCTKDVIAFDKHGGAERHTRKRVELDLHHSNKKPLSMSGLSAKMSLTKAKGLRERHGHS